jgi:hypothetical protein
LVTTGWNSSSAPVSGRRSLRPAFAFGGVTAVIVMPSMSKSASAATTSPTLAPG